MHQLKVHQCYRPHHTLFSRISAEVSQVFFSSERSKGMGNWRIYFYCGKGFKATLLKAPLLLPSSPVLTLESRWTHSQRSASSPLCPSVRPLPMSATYVKWLPHPLRLLSLTTCPYESHGRHHVWAWLPSVSDSLRGKKPQHCPRCGPLLFRSAEEPSDLPQPIHWHAGLSFSSLFPV